MALCDRNQFIHPSSSCFKLHHTHYSPPACQVAEEPRKRAGYESWQRFKDALIVDNLKPKSLGVAWGLQESGESLIDFVLQKGEMRHIKFDF